MAYNSLPRIGSRPMSAGTWDMTRRQRLNNDPHVRFADGSFSRPTSERDVPLYSGPSSEAATIIQLRDDLRQCQEEITRKNKLLAQMASVDSTKTEHTALLDKIELLESQLVEARSQLERRDDKIVELSRLIEMSRDNDSRHAAAARELRRQIGDYQQQQQQQRINAGSAAGSSPGPVPDVTALYDRIRDLEDRIRAHAMEREKVEQDRATMERKLSEMFRLLMLDSEYRDINNLVSSLDHVINKAREVVQDNATLKGRLSSAESQLSAAESDLKAQRETITKLMNDQQNTSQLNTEMGNLHVERDVAERRQKELEGELEAVKERLEASQRAWSAMRKELAEEKSQRAADVDRDRLAAAADQQAKAFKDCLATMLSDSRVSVEPYEEQIRARVESTIVTLHNKTAQIKSLEEKLSKMASQLDAQYELNRVADRKTKRAEADTLELEQKLRQFDCANSLPTHNAVMLQQDKYLRLLERMSGALKMPPFPADMCVDEATSAVVARAEQLCHDSDHTSLVCGLRHKVKRLKQKLADKETEMTSVQRKLLSVEDQLAARPDANDAFAKNRKLMSLVDNYNAELNEAHREIRELKSRLMDTADAKLRMELKERDIAGLEAKLDQLEQVKDRQAGQLETLRQSRVDLDEKSCEATTTIRHLTDELNKLKYTLDDVTRRQKQLVQLRQTVGRMLGLNVGPDSSSHDEIVSRLEKLILANRDNMASSIPVDASFEQLAHAFRQGQSPSVTFDLDKSRSRPRSVSPARKRDTKVY